MKFSPRRRRYLKSRIRVLRDQGLSNREISGKLNISKRSIYRLAPSKKEGVSTDYRAANFFKKGAGRASPVTRDLAIRLRGFGLTREVVTWCFSVHPSTGHLILFENQHFARGSEVSCGECIEIESTCNLFTDRVSAIPIRCPVPRLVNTRYPLS